MKFKLSEDKHFLFLDDCTELEYSQICSSFTKKLDNWYIIKRKKPYWNCEVSFFSEKTQRIAIGLWGEIKNFAQKYNFLLSIDGTEYLMDQTFKKEDFDEWVNEFFPEPEKPEDFYPKPHQIEGCKKALKFRLCIEEISTSGGKTLMAHMIFRYLYDRGIIKNMLYVVPNIDLIGQTEEKFYLYEEITGHTPNWKSICVFSGASKKQDKDPQIVFGTYQSLTKRGPEYFENFDMVLIDECHHSKNSSLKNILAKCYNAKYKIGLTGTLPPEGSCSSFTIQSYLGPKVYTISSADLISEGSATPVNVIGIEMDYLTEEKKKMLYDLRDVKADEKDGLKLLNLEKELARDSRKRLLYICEMINKTKKNSLVLFADIKHGYGRKIYDWLRENTDKEAYYIDGATKLDNRDFYKEKMEKEENIVLVASTGVFSEGIDLPSIRNIFITESHRSEIMTRQMLGRGMRLLEGKNLIVVVDFSDSYYWNGVNKFQRKNYLLRHASERERIYKERGFPFKKFKIKLS